MAEQTDNGGGNEGDGEDGFAPLQSKYVTFMEAGPGIMKVRPKGKPDAKETEVPIVIVAVAEGFDIERFALQPQDAGNLACEVITALAYKGVEWARRVAGAIAVINKEMAEEFGPSADEASGG